MHSMRCSLFLDVLRDGLWQGLLVLAVGAMTAGVSPVQAQDGAAGAFSRLGFSARGIAMGNALTASTGANTSPYYNPALAPTANGQRLSASAAIMSFDREMQFLEFSTPIGPTAGIALGLIHGGVSDIDGRDANGIRTQTLSTDEFGLFLSFGNRFAERLSVGATLKIYQSNLDDVINEARSFGVDLGTRVTITEALHVGASVSDLLAKYEWGQSGGGRTNTDYFPTRVRVGAEYTLLGDRLHLVGEYESRFTRRDDRRRVVVPTTRGPQTQFRTETLLLHDARSRLGASYQLHDILNVRAGLDRIGVDGTDGLRPTAGFGIDESVGNLDVTVSYALALEPYVRNTIHLFSLGIFL